MTKSSENRTPPAESGPAAPAGPRAHFWTAVVVALGLLLAGHAAYRAAAARYARPVDSVRIPPGTLARLPVQVGAWRGRDQPLSKWIIRATDTDDHVNRVYQRGPEAVGLYVGYGIRLRDLLPHRPEVCYPGAGWTLQQTDQAKLTRGDGRQLPCQIHRFARAGLETDAVTVLNYYLVDGEYCADVSLLRTRAARVPTGASYAAQVQISCSTAPFREQADGLVREFALESVPLIEQLLQEAVHRSLAQDPAPR